MDIWSWICELPDSEEWNESNSQQILPLASSKNKNSETRSIKLRAERVRGLDSEVSLTFSICFVGFPCLEEKETTIWASDIRPLDWGKPFLPLVLQLLQEIVSRSPTAHDSSNLRRWQLEKPNLQPVSWILDSYSPESFSSFFNLIFLMHLFWLCAWDSPSEVGSFYFHSLLAPNIDAFTCKHAPVMRSFFIAIGADVEHCFMRTFGYILAKWLILRDVEAGIHNLTHLPSKNLGFSYAMEAHGLWILKGYAPVKSMNCVQSFQGQKGDFPSVLQATESLLKYALAHQQLEAVIQLEYTVGFHENYVQVNARVDNLRLHVGNLGFKKDEDKILLEEKYFPSRIQMWVGPEAGAGYVGGLSLGRSTDNVEREMEIEKILKGSFENSKSPKVKAMEKKATRAKIKNWRWDQDVEGNVAIFDASLCDTTTGVEVAMWKPIVGGDIRIDFKNRYTGGGRGFSKSGGLVVSGADCGGSVGWRISKEMEGSVLKWRMGGKIWVTYFANNVRTSYYETRCIEWCDEVDLPIIPSQN
ncbi:LOW QUALITY PROTEIN: uncharacterized protein [Primulina eburnea]|uniref:LOW QUALITY PROTEIN: uncharacterized protein n=1 Tax=Primulina eburnea TaxID=1245227 RepID=UPI003C6BFF6F